ncbi:MAG: transcriptional regulator BetI [Alphaproteobacteria bacterium]|nr:transcriptional regulator BetI [Alphaproteobacteria bacterium]MBU0805537.1 transcriptional regulator BetI [Alphaproteobacteria bacterium]MBU0873483.1 transcriptional regulator BetI [Alphaproteobacteria bacterium]MBU1401289.1 transcriptional regulator BetI [Alphaproteobacteria bacterium]MBU1592294.1 transcriptional regulator BetI [Alphaproteobacteria bacterium]
MAATMKTAALGRLAPEMEKSGEGEKRGRKASKEVRRQQLIEATIDSLAKRGYSETTMADVADGAGLSRGIVNFHFESKEKLLVATLKYMADEYSAHWRAAYQKAGDNPARQLELLVAADFDRSICNRRKLAAWCAFWGEAKSRPTYQALCGSRDEAYQNVFVEICARLKAESGYAFEPYATAVGLCAMLEGLWLRLMMGTEGMTRESAHHAACEYLVSVFPKQFTRASLEAHKIA